MNNLIETQEIVTVNDQLWIQFNKKNNFKQWVIYTLKYMLQMISTHFYSQLNLVSSLHGFT